MSIRSLVVVGLAVICGLAAALGMNQLRQPSQIEVKPETAPIVIAAVDIPRGRMVSGDDLKIRQWPKDILPEGALTKLEDAQERAAMVPVLAGEPLLEAKLANKDAGRGLAALIPSGMRAYTIQTSRIASSVAGFVLPGNRVDVLLNLRGQPNDETGGGSTTTLLQAVEILAVDQELDAPADSKKDPRDLGSVTLLVTPEQAALLDLGQNLGTLTLSLRNPEDIAEADAQPATLNDIRFHQEKPLEEPESGQSTPIQRKTEPEPEVYEIVTLRGSQRGRVLVTPNNQ